MTKQRRQAVGVWILDTLNDIWEAWDGIVKGSQGVDLQQDEDHNALVMVDATHVEVHDGRHFYIEGFTQLEDTDEFLVKLETPDSTMRADFNWGINSNGVLETYLYEAPSGSIIGGSPVTPFNSNRNLSASSVITITKGVSASPAYGLPVGATKMGGTGFKSTTGGTNVPAHQIILKQNTVYLRRFISHSASNIVSFRADWNEIDHG